MKSKQASPRASPSLAGPKKSIDKNAKPLSKAARRKQLNLFTNPIVVLQSSIKHHKMQIEEFTELNEIRRPSQQLTKEIEYIRAKTEKEEGRLEKMIKEFETTTAKARAARQKSASDAQKAKADAKAEKELERERLLARREARREVLREAEEQVARGDTNIDHILAFLRESEEADGPKKMEVAPKPDDGSEKAEEGEDGEEEEAPDAECSDKADDSEEEEEEADKENLAEESDKSGSEEEEDGEDGDM